LRCFDVHSASGALNRHPRVAPVIDGFGSGAHNAFDRHGGLMDIGSLPENLSRGLRENISLYRSFDKEFHIGYVENKAFNAFACIDQEQYYVGLYFGAILHLSALAYCIFSDPAMFTEIGDTEKEFCEPAIKDALQQGDLFRIPSARYLPNDPVRLDAAQRIAQCAFMLLYLHENAHIRGGHLKLIVDEFGATTYQELTVLPVTEEESLFFRSLELEADTLALANGLRAWRNLYRGFNYSEISALGPTRSWRIAAQLLFWAMSIEHQKLRARALPTHPDPFVRLVNMTIIQGFHGELDKDLIEAHERHEDSLHGWMASSLPEEVSGAMISDPGEVADEIARLKGHIASLWPRLDRYRWSAMSCPPPAPAAAPASRARSP
jgi:hypothetical protein